MTDYGFQQSNIDKAELAELVTQKENQFRTVFANAPGADVLSSMLRSLDFLCLIYEGRTKTMAGQSIVLPIAEQIARHNYAIELLEWVRAIRRADDGSIKNIGVLAGKLLEEIV